MRGYSPIPVRGSRAVVNHLIALLKRAYPQALALIGEDPAAPLPPAFLRRRPSPLAAKKAGPSRLREFCRRHGPSPTP